MHLRAVLIIQALIFGLLFGAAFAHCQAFPAPLNLVGRDNLTVVPAQPSAVQVSVSPWTKKAVQRALSKRAAKTVHIWTVAIENASSEALGISESAVIRKVTALQPYNAKGVELLLAESQRNSAWARSGRAVQDLMFAALYLQTAGTIQIGKTATIAVSAAGALAPHAVERLKGAEPPVLRNFTELAWREPIRLAPGESATAYLFTAAPEKGQKLQAITVGIDTARIEKVKLVQ